MRNLYLLLILFLICGCRGFSRTAPQQQDIPLNRIIDSLQLNNALQLDENKLYLYIDKSDYLLSIMFDSLIIKQYRVVFGGNPVDDKLQQGDQCTPEGTFKVISKYPHRSWNKFIWIDYPNTQSWKKFNEAKRQGLIPEDANIGGEIGIHGVPEGTNSMIDMKVNWTLGCISLKNMDINEIYPYISKNTRVVIVK